MSEAGEAEEAGPHLGRAVRLARTARGLKRREVAQRTGLTYPYLSQIERGVRRPSSRVLRMIADALDMPADELVSMGDSAADGHSSSAAAGVPETDAPPTERLTWRSEPQAETQAEAPARPTAPPPHTPAPATPPVAGTPPAAAAAADGETSADEEIARLVQLAQRLSRDDVVLLVDFARRLLP